MRNLNVYCYTITDDSFEFVEYSSFILYDEIRINNRRQPFHYFAIKNPIYQIYYMYTDGRSLSVIKREHVWSDKLYTFERFQILISGTIWRINLHARVA